MRQIVLDTETTGLDPARGHRVIEIGGVELVDRRLTGQHFHQYLQPDREIDEGALAVHGITLDFLADKPRFVEVAESFIDYIKGAQLIIHNAPFDVGFLNHELQRLGKQWGCIEDHCEVIDTLVVARKLHPGKKNNLDALCKRYFVENSQRQLHGALLDAEILAEVYLAMTGGQISLGLGGGETSSSAHTGQARQSSTIKPVDTQGGKLTVHQASAGQQKQHDEFLDKIQQTNDKCVWRS